MTLDQFHHSEHSGYSPATTYASSPAMEHADLFLDNISLEEALTNLKEQHAKRRGRNEKVKIKPAPATLADDAYPTTAPLVASPRARGLDADTAARLLDRIIDEGLKRGDMAEIAAEVSTACRLAVDQFLQLLGEMARFAVSVVSILSRVRCLGRLGSSHA